MSLAEVFWYRAKVDLSEPGSLAEELHMLVVSAFIRTLRIAIVCVAAASVSACSSGKSGGTSVVKLEFPSNPPLAEKVGSLVVGPFIWANACFIVNVTTPEVAPKFPNGSCSIPVGVLSGSAKPGGSLELSVPFGSSRVLDVFAYVQANASLPCPTVAGGFGALDLGKIVRVGRSKPFDTKTKQVEVTVAVSQPTTATDVVEQYGLPSSCRPVPPPPPAGAGGSRTVSGVVTHEGTSAGITYRIQGTISGRSNEAELSGGGLFMHLTRKSR